MDFGIHFASGADSWRFVQLAEELGYARAWFTDSPTMHADVFASMAVAAMKTSRIRLSTGIFVPGIRPPLNAASGLATVNALAPGRIDWGIGTGNTARDCQGLPALKLADVTAYVQQVRQLLAGDVVSIETEDGLRKVALTDGDALGLVNTSHPIPYLLSAMGPRSRRIAAETADGWITAVGRPWPAHAEELDEYNRACAAAGRSADEMDTVLFISGTVLRPDEAFDSERVMETAGPIAAAWLHATQSSKQLPAGDSDMGELLSAHRDYMTTLGPADARHIELHRGHAQRIRDDERRFITPELIRKVTMTRSRDELIEFVRNVREAGYKHLAIQLVTGHEEEQIRDWHEVISRA